jgi:uncharacterized repeat protein (TIGR03803 family)
MRSFCEPRGARRLDRSQQTHGCRVHDPSMTRRPHPLAVLARAAALAVAAACLPAHAGAAAFEVLHPFDGTHGAEPFGGVAIDASGAIYGVTVSGGLKHRGVLYRLQDHHFDVLHAFRGAPRDGDAGYGGLVLDAEGRLLGTTAWGGSADAGTAFSFDAVLGYRLVVSFPGGAAGRGLQAGLAAGTDGQLYGTTVYGGDAYCDCGTVFRLDGRTGALTPLHAFTGPDGSYPVAPPLPLGDTLKGTTTSGGTRDVGGPFAMTEDGRMFAPLVADGATQFASGLVADASGVLWGVWRGGDTDNGGIYRIAPDGTFSIAHRFAGAQGYWPTGTLIVGRDGALYGTTTQGGRYGAGTVFRYDRIGRWLATLHAFSGPDGAHPQAGVVQDAEGRFVGVTTGGGLHERGVVFRITP